MSALLRTSKRTTGETVLLVDVESGSVAAGLAVLRPGEAPKLFAEYRVMLPVAKTLDAATLARQIERATREAIATPSLLAARLRNAAGSDAKIREKFGRMGAVSRAALFFAPPWAAPEERRGTLRWSREPALAAALRQEIEAVFGTIPVFEYGFGEAAVGALYSLFEQPGELLLCTVTGEIAELLRLREGALQSHATIPTGSHTILRTLGSHAGITFHEARSALVLGREHASGILREPLTAAAADFAAQFAGAVSAIAGRNALDEVLIIAPEPSGEWFARALSYLPAGGPFSEEGSVRALHTRHLAPYVTGHTPVPDLMLMTEVIFIDAFPPSVY